jgi:hypothetical protein
LLSSAAHCVQNKNAQFPLKADEIYAYLGRYNFKVADEGNATKMDIEEILIHPEWRPFEHSYDADVALLKTKNNIAFNDYVTPVCLPTLVTNVFNINGYVVGYGKSENAALHETRPKHVRLRSVTQDVCLFSDPLFVRISSLRMFCAGEKGKNPCKGERNLLSCYLIMLI